MKQTLVPNKGISTSLLWIMAIISGVTVANLYFNQPVLNMISTELGISSLTANWLPIITQLGYAVGLLFIIPLGDLVQVRRILTVNFTLLAISLLATALTSNIYTLLFTSFIIGAGSVMPHIFIPMASQYSTPERKTQNVGILLGGLLTGILASRVVSGIMGEHFGWRAIYYVATVLMAVCLVVILKMLPSSPSTFQGSYASLMKSMFGLVKNNKILQNVSLRAALCFGCFQGMWAVLVFKMSGEPFYASNDTIGLLGLCGMMGALTATSIGRYINKLGVRTFHLIGCGVLIASWLVMYIFQNSYLGMIIGIIAIDGGMQCIQLSNQSKALSLVPQATNRVNTIFMTTFFLGASLGTFIAGFCWNKWAWEGVAFSGIIMTLLSVLLTFSMKEKV